MKFLIGATAWLSVMLKVGASPHSLSMVKTCLNAVIISLSVVEINDMAKM